MTQHLPSPVPNPHLVGTPPRPSQPRLGRAAALMAAGIALPIASGWLMADGLHLWRLNHALPWVIQEVVTAMSLGWEVWAILLAWRSSAVIARAVVVTVAGMTTLLLLLFAVTGLVRVVNLLTLKQ